MRARGSWHARVRAFRLTKAACVRACQPVVMTFLEHICAVLTRQRGSNPAHPPGEAPSQEEPEGLEPLCTFPLDSLGAD